MAGMLLWTAVLAVAPSARKSDPAVPAETVIRLTVDAMPAPKPALRYLLLPELREMTPGNPIPNYLKCFMDRDLSPDQESLSRAALKLADRAARMDTPDWQILTQAKTEGANLLIPDVQKMRELAAALQARFRDEIALRRFDDALVTAKTMFALSRHMAEHPTLIGDLVGIALAYITLGPLEELIEQPGCPNLYWALVQLPTPFIPLDRGMEGERLLVAAELKDLDDSFPMSPAQIARVVTKIDYLRAFEPDRLKITTRRWLLVRAGNSDYLTAARRRLVEYGLSAERVERFPPDQVILLDERREYETRRDEVLKYLKLRQWEAEALAARPVSRSAVAPALLQGLLPALHKVRRAQGRLEQRLAMLRHVEALRMHAAGHGGQLPDSLTQVDVPLPVDPFTGQPFRYERVGETAHLRGTPPRGEEQNPAYNIHYEITIRR